MNIIFTSYLKIKDSACDELYVNELIPQWVKVNQKYCDEIHIITNIPDAFAHLTNIHLHSISITEAFNGVDPNAKVFHHQVKCWKVFLETLKDKECCVYLDPDAFLFDSEIFNIAFNTEHHQLSKKKFPYGESDAGIAILRNTPQTKELLKTILSAFEDKALSPRCIIEHYYDKMFRGDNKYYIPWSKYSIGLRNVICGNNENLNAIHGEYNGKTKLTSDQEHLLSLILEKEKRRKY